MLVDGVVVFASGVELHGIRKEFDQVREEKANMEGQQP